MTEVVINVHEDGHITCLDQQGVEFLKRLGKVITQRASHVEPESRLLRGVFHALRGFSGDKGWLASFTRHWTCRWRVNMSPIGGPILARRYSNRQAAIDAEVAYLNEYMATLVETKGSVV